MELNEETIEYVRLALNVSSETLVGLLENADTRAIVEQIAAFMVEKNEDIEEYESTIQQFQEFMESKDAELSELDSVQTKVSYWQLGGTMQR